MKTNSAQENRVPRAIPLRIVNGLGNVLRKAGILSTGFCVESLIESACRRTQLSDWGEDEFMTGLRVLLSSYEHDAQLSPIGHFICKETCLLILANRLYIQDQLKQHPEILQRPITRPLIIVGLPRTGTTLLHCLLAQDPGSRSLRIWETESLAPLPHPQTYYSDPRIERTRKKFRFGKYLVPNFPAIHPVEAENVEECLFLMRNNFVCPLYFEPLARVTGYAHWLDAQDLVPTYEYFKKQLQLLQWNFPPQKWVLKSPGHLYKLDALLKVFPDACIVHIHRDPKEVIASWCSLVVTLQGMVSDCVYPAKTGERWLDLWVQSMKRAVAVRDTEDPRRFYDVDYGDLVQDPMKVVEKIYSHFNYEMTSQMQTSAQKWLAENPRHKHGVHRYSLQQFGLDEQQVQAQFSFYLERFPVRGE